MEFGGNGNRGAKGSRMSHGDMVKNLITDGDTGKRCYVWELSKG
jgi:hypothetical protein